MLNHLSIEFCDNPNGIYEPNEIVTGSIELKVVKEIEKAQSLRLVVEGGAACKWIQSSKTNTKKRSMIKTFHGKEKYLSSMNYLFGSKDGETTKVTEGSHSYSFSFPLPLEIPFSVDGKHRYVRYKVEAVLEVDQMPDLSTKRPFTVIRCEELKFCPELRLPVEVEEIKRFCYLLCKSSPLILIVRLPKTVFLLSETIPISVEMVNKSFTNVSHTVLVLNRIDKLYSQSPVVKTKNMKKLIVERRCQGISRGESLKLDELITIPNDSLITIDRHCNVFQTSYELRFTAETEGLRGTPYIEIPITIGSANSKASAPPNYDDVSF